MEKTLILLAFVQICVMILTAIAGYQLVKRNFQRKIDEYTVLYHDFTDSPGDNQPSPVAIVLDTLAKSAGHSMALEIKTTLMGHASGASKQEAAIMADIGQDIFAQEQPILSGVLDSFPTLKKRLQKNPQLIDAVMSALKTGNGGGGMAAVTGSNSSSGGKVSYSKYG